jgi:5-methylcytosine-specific restriction endonuclease McrA
MYRPQTNAWMLANKPHFPTEPCIACGKPVVQYRKRRYGSELRYCSTSCRPSPPRVYGPGRAELLDSKWEPSGCAACDKTRSGRSNRRCRDCGKRRRLLMIQLRNRLRWLLPKICLGCGDEFNRFDQGSRCNRCKRDSVVQAKQLRRLRANGGEAYEPGIDYRKLYLLADGRCCICQLPCDDPSVWLSWDGLNWMPNAPTVDHIVALANGGTHTWNNVQLACLKCNSYKSNRS